ncbi:MAG: Spx/MgsR family RNA polymerase-binding regulatory protein [Candidatus Cloacimonetes bacterium]|nr:Spx/MgsR family RNA polymerase-binding regulatory protein [Candidatus Cloacimonadota bacterium]
MSIHLYGIKNCSQVKKAKDFLKEKSINFVEVDVRKDGLERQTVNHWLRCRGLESVFNKRSKAYKDLDLGDVQIDESKFLDLIEESPLLFKRPLLVQGDTVLIGLKEIQESDLS